MLPRIGPVELILILVIVTMLFGVGKLPEVFGAVGRGIREFRRGASEGETQSQVTATEVTATEVTTGEVTTGETPTETQTEATTVSTAGDGNTHQS